jgi:hypothetical protein
MVVKVEITTIKIGILTWSGITFRKIEMTILEQVNTKITAAPMARQFSTLTETAKTEQRPIMRRNTGFSPIIPFLK